MFFKKKAQDVALTKKAEAQLQLVDAMSALHSAQGRVNYLQQVIDTFDRMISEGRLSNTPKVEPKSDSNVGTFRIKD